MGLQAKSSQQAGKIGKKYPSFLHLSPVPEPHAAAQPVRLGTPKPGTHHIGLPAKYQPASKVTAQCIAPLTTPAALNRALYLSKNRDKLQRRRAQAPPPSHGAAFVLPRNASRSNQQTRQSVRDLQVRSAQGGFCGLGCAT